MPQPKAKTQQLPAAIHEMVRRIVARFDPEQVILFGSYARGTAGPDSDADLLVVMDFDGMRRPKVVEIYEAIGAVGLAKDIILATPNEWGSGHREPGSLVHTAFHEGVVLYDLTRTSA